MQSEHGEGIGLLMGAFPSAKRPVHDDVYERELVEGIARGDNEAWAELHQIYFWELTEKIAWDLYSVYGTKDHDRAEELAQETLVRVRTAASRFQGNSSVGWWINQIKNNVVSELRRKIGHHPVLPFMPRRSPDDIDEMENIEELVQDPKPDPCTRVFEEKRRQEVVSPLVLEAISELERCHPACFEAYKLKYVYGITSTKTIAQRLGVPPGTVKSRLSRARQFLRKALENKGCPNPFLDR